MRSTQMAIRTAILLLSLIHLSISLQTQQQKAQQYKGVILAKDQTVRQLLRNNSKVVVFFSEASCKYCQEFSQTYSLVANVLSSEITYVKVEYSEETQSFFNQHAVEDVPYIIAFEAGNALPWHFQCLGSNNSVLAHLLKWVDRVYGEIGQWKNQDDHSHQLVVDCQSSRYRNMWNNISRTNLWLDLYCGSADFLKSSFAVVSENGKSIEAWQIQRENIQEIQELQQKINKLILGYKYKYVLNWNVGIAQEIFVKKQNAFVLIVNNESLSQEVFGYYEEAKKYWFERVGGHEAPVLFSVSDLSKTTDETTRLKRYLTGMAVANRKQYSYPILAYIHHQQNGKVTRYVLNFSVQKTKSNIQQFMESIHEHIILKKEYKEGEAVLNKWLNELIIPDQLGNPKPKQSKDQLEKEETNATDKRRLKSISNQTHWQDLLNTEKTPSPFFVYVSWGHHYELQKLHQNLKKWWQKDAQSEPQYDSRINLYTNQLDFVDLPDHPGLQVEYVPSLLHIDHAKQVTQLPGVTDINKIKTFISQQFKLHEQQYQPHK